MPPAGPPPAATDRHASPGDAGQLLGRLVAAGLTPVAAGSLVLEHPRQRLVDVLDALEVLGPGEVAEPGAWVVDALEQDRDVSGVLADRRRHEHRRARWERQQAARDRAAAAADHRQQRSDRWGAAVSAALDDDQLAAAVATVTTPLAGLGRRSVPVARAQLLAWAVAAHQRCPDQPLGTALAADLEAGPGALDPLDDGLPDPPTSASSDDDLAGRIAGLLERRSELERPGAPPREPPTRPLDRVLERSLGR